MFSEFYFIKYIKFIFRNYVQVKLNVDIPAFQIPPLFRLYSKNITYDKFPKTI